MLSTLYRWVQGVWNVWNVERHFWMSRFSRMCCSQSVRGSPAL